MFFILTTGRSGSTSIASTLDLMPECYAVHEPAPELILESAGYRYGQVSPVKVREKLAATRSATVDGKIYCESNQTLSLIIPELIAAFPEARFIWLVRNGLDVVASTYQKQWYTGHSENHDRYEDCSTIEKAWIDGRVQADLAGEMSKSEWNALDRFEKCCWYWGYVNKIIGEDLEKYAPDRFFSIRLEDLEQGFTDLANWMGLTPPAIQKLPWDNIAKRIPFHWTDWSPEQHQAFVRWCKEGMDMFYPGWQNYTAGDSKIFIAPALVSLRSRIEILEETLRAARADNEEIREASKGVFTRCLKRLGNPFGR